MFRCLQNQTSNSKVIFFRNDLTCTPFLNLSRFSLLKKQRVFTRHKFFAFLATSKPVPVERVEHGQLYYDNYDNMRMTTPVRWPINVRRFIAGPNEEKIMNNLKTGQWIPVEDEMPYNFKIEGVKIRKREDGMFVNFTFQVDPTQKEKALKEIIERVQTFLKDKSNLFFDMRAYLVKGEPFIEELIDRYPASRLRVEFQGSEVFTETLYEYFEQYGSIRDINLYPASHKALLPHAFVQYSKVRSAVCAKNCVHGTTVNGTRLNILYDRPIKMLRIYKWIVNHPTLSTISIPLIPIVAVAIVAGLTYGLDFSCYLLIKSNIMYYHLYQRYKEKTINLLMFFREKLEEEPFDFSTKEQEDKLRNWLKDPPESFIVLIGPTNSGKSTIVNKILQGKRNTIFIKCDDILYSRSKSERALELAKQVGCSPVFNVVISLSKLGNLLADEVIGHKIFGLPSTIDDPIKKIFEMLENALTKKKRRIQKTSGVIEGHSEECPIVVIDAYTIKHIENHENYELWESLVKFATTLVKKKLAHVVFVSSNIGISDRLKLQVPSIPVKPLDLHDPNEVMNMVKKYSHDKKVEFHEGLKDAVSHIGLHLTDLRLFFKEIHSGANPDDALKNLINEAKNDIYKLAFNDDSAFAPKKWSDIQFWAIMKGLSKNKYIFYDIIKSSAIFNDNDTPIRAMEQAGLISITQLPDEYSVSIIKASKLLYQKAFEEISNDKLFDTKMKYKTAQYNLSLENNKIKEYEYELEKLVKIDSNWNNKWSVGWWWFGSSRDIIDFRVKFLLSNLKKSLARAKKYQRQIDELKQIYESTLNEAAIKNK